MNWNLKDAKLKMKTIIAIEHYLAGEMPMDASQYRVLLGTLTRQMQEECLLHHKDYAAFKEESRKEFNL